MGNQLDKAFRDSIVQNEIKNILSDSLEFGIDQIIENDLVKEIPVVKTVISFYKAGIGIKKRFTIKKILKFLFQLNETTIKEKQNFLESIQDQEKQDDLFEKLLVILDRFDDLEKAKITGNLFKSTIVGNIEINDFFKLASIIDRAYIEDIKALCFTKNDNCDNNTKIEYVFKFSSTAQKSLASLGLMNEKITAKIVGINDTTEYQSSFECNRLGNILAEFAF